MRTQNSEPSLDTPILQTAKIIWLYYTDGQFNKI